MVMLGALLESLPILPLSVLEARCGHTYKAPQALLPMNFQACRKAPDTPESTCAPQQLAERLH